MIACKAGAIMTWGMNVIGQEETMGTTLAAASYSATMRPWLFKSATMSVARHDDPDHRVRLEWR